MQKSDEGKKAKTRLHPFSLTTQVCILHSTRSVSATVLDGTYSISRKGAELCDGVVASDLCLCRREYHGLAQRRRHARLERTRQIRGPLSFLGALLLLLLLFGNARSHQRSSLLHSHWGWCRYNIRKSGVLCCLIMYLNPTCRSGGRLIILHDVWLYNISPCCHLVHQYILVIRCTCIKGPLRM